jgi:hypothetical protein
MLDRISGDPATQAYEVWRLDPSEDGPVGDRLAWHDRMAELYDQMAAARIPLPIGAAWAADYHLRRAKELREQISPHQPWVRSATW